MFSCGTTKEGESYIVEWNESEGAVKRMYHGLGKRSVGVVQFDTMQNRFLAAGDDFLIKFWDMDNLSLLTTADAEGGLPVAIKFSLIQSTCLLSIQVVLHKIVILSFKNLRLHLAFGLATQEYYWLSQLVRIV